MRRWCLLLLFAAGCRTAYPINEPLKQYRPEYGYRFSRYFPELQQDSTFVILTFSGGGTRAAALAYGVLLELDKTEVQPGRTLLDEVDLISGVSGGSFTATYYALYGKQGLPEFERTFLRKNIQGMLKGALRSPRNLWRLLSPNFSRVDLAQEIYDREVFKGKTFGDLYNLRRRPFVIVNAAEIDIGGRFEFTQEQFDRICSDLQTFPIARAVAASSAVPVLLTPIRIRSYAGTCGYVEPAWIDPALADYPNDPMLYRNAWEKHTYLDKDRVAFHLMDGGLSDNLGLRAPLKALSWSKDDFSLVELIAQDKIKRVVVVVVNAGHEISASVDTMDKIIGVPTVVRKNMMNMMTAYSFETMALLSKIAEDIDAGQLKGVKPVEVYVINVGLIGVSDPKDRDFFNVIPTSFNLTKEQIDRLIAIGPTLMKESDAYQELLRDLRASH